MTQQANAGASKGDRNPAAVDRLLRWWLPHNWPDTGPMLGLERALTWVR
jgi:hypothetical protein